MHTAYDSTDFTTRKTPDMEMIKLKMTMGKDQTEAVTRNVTIHKPKLPKFEEDKDDMDIYLQRFERFAKMQKWKPEEWVVSLSPLLTGKGLEVYTSMPDTDLDNYDQLKLALLKRYQLTEEGFPKKFRESKSEKGETVHQFVARLSRYFRRWVELSGITKTYDGLQDFMVREQYLSICGQNLEIFLRERTPKDTKEMARLAEQYIEARGMESESDSNFKTAAAAFPVRTPSYGERQCYICHRTNHIARDCFYREQHPRYNSNAGGEYSQSNRVYNAESEKEHIGSGMIDEYMMGDTSMRAEGNSKERMPVREGVLNNSKVQVLRDTGCSSAAVKMSLVKKHQLTGNDVTCTLIDGTQRRFPLARIQVNMPYFTGEVEAMCIENPLYDLIIGNVPAVSNTPDPEQRMQGNAATTHSKEEKTKRPIKPLTVPAANQGKSNGNNSAEQRTLNGRNNKTPPNQRTLNRRNDRNPTNKRNMNERGKDNPAMQRNLNERSNEDPANQTNMSGRSTENHANQTNLNGRKYKTTENQGNLQGKAYQYPWNQGTEDQHEEITLVPSEVKAYIERLQTDMEIYRYELMKKDEELKELIGETYKMREERVEQANLLMDWDNLHSQQKGVIRKQAAKTHKKSSSVLWASYNQN